MKNQFPKMLILLLFGIVFNLQGRSESQAFSQTNSQLLSSTYCTAQSFIIKNDTSELILQDTVKRKKTVLKINSPATSTGENLKPRR